jgi:hypothetical protein
MDRLVWHLMSLLQKGRFTAERLFGNPLAVQTAPTHDAKSAFAD